MSGDDGKAGRSAAWGVLAGVTGAGAVAVWIAATSPGSKFPIWPAYPLGAVAVTGLYMCFAVLYGWWPAGRQLRGGATTAQERPLEVKAGKPHYHDWDVAASVAAFPVKVTNRTGEPVILPGDCTCNILGGDAPSWQSSLRGTGLESSFFREVGSQRNTSHHQPAISERTTIPAHASLELWYVMGIGRDHRGLRPRITLHFNDADGNEYTVAFGQQEPRQVKRRASLTMRRKP